MMMETQLKEEILNIGAGFEERRVPLLRSLESRNGTKIKPL